jgi:DNA-binding transcriptional regulator YiaG
MTTGNFLKSIRKKVFSLGQKDFADHYSVTQGAVSNWENNRKRCSGHLLLNIMTDAYNNNQAAFIRAFKELSKERAKGNER